MRSEKVCPLLTRLEFQKSRVRLVRFYVQGRREKREEGGKITVKPTSTSSHQTRWSCQATMVAIGMEGDDEDAGRRRGRSKVGVMASSPTWSVTSSPWASPRRTEVSRAERHRSLLLHHESRHSSSMKQSTTSKLRAHDIPHRGLDQWWPYQEYGTVSPLP